MTKKASAQPQYTVNVFRMWDMADSFVHCENITTYEAMIQKISEGTGTYVAFVKHSAISMLGELREELDRQARLFQTQISLSYHPVELINTKHSGLLGEIQHPNLRCMVYTDVYARRLRLPFRQEVELYRIPQNKPIARPRVVRDLEGG